MKYQNIIFDLDSTLSSIEGIEVFIRRLELIKPTKAELLTVSKLYRKNITPGAVKLISWLRRQKINIFVVTAGYTDCSYPLTDFLKISRQNIFANRLNFNSDGEFIGVDKSIPLWRGGVIFRPAVAAKAKVVITQRNLYALRKFLNP